MTVTMPRYSLSPTRRSVLPPSVEKLEMPTVMSPVKAVERDWVAAALLTAAVL